MHQQLRRSATHRPHRLHAQRGRGGPNIPMTSEEHEHAAIRRAHEIADDPQHRRRVPFTVDIRRRQIGRHHEQGLPRIVEGRGKDARHGRELGRVDPQSGGEIFESTFRGECRARHDRGLHTRE